MGKSGKRKIPNVPSNSPSDALVPKVASTKSGRRKRGKREKRKDLQSRRKDIENKLRDAKEIMQKRQKQMAERAKAALQKEQAQKRAEAQAKRTALIHAEYNKGVKVVQKCMQRYLDGISQDVSRFINLHMNMDSASNSSHESEDFLGLGSSGGNGGNNKLVLPKEFDSCRGKKDYVAEFELQGLRLPVKGALQFPVGKKRDLKRIGSLQSRIKAQCEQGNGDITSILVLCRELNLLQYETELSGVIVDSLCPQSNAMDVSMLVQELCRMYGTKFLVPQTTRQIEQIQRQSGVVLDMTACSSAAGADLGKVQQLCLVCLSRGILTGTEDEFVACVRSLLSTGLSLLRGLSGEEKLGQLKIIAKVLSSLVGQWGAELTGCDVASGPCFESALQYTRGFSLDSSLEPGKAYSIHKLSELSAEEINKAPLPNVIVGGRVACLLRAGQTSVTQGPAKVLPIVSYDADVLADAVEDKMMSIQPLQDEDVVVQDRTLFSTFQVKGAPGLRDDLEQLQSACRQALAVKDTERVATVKRLTRILRFRGLLTAAQQASQTAVVSITKQLLDICNTLEDSMCTDKPSHLKEVLLEDDVAVLLLTEAEKQILRSNKFLDAEERRFYENQPDVQFYTGGGEEVVLAEKTIKKPEDEQEMDDIISILNAYSQLSLGNGSGKAHVDAPDDIPDDGPDDDLAVAVTEVDALQESLLLASSAVSVDEVLDTVLLHSTNKKSKVAKIVALVTQCPVSQAARAPFLSRAIARLARSVPSVGEEVVEYFRREVEGAIRTSVGSLERRLKTVRFVAELAKFQLPSSSSVVFACWSLLQSKPTPHNVQLLATLLDLCGRWLYCEPSTHATTRAFRDMSYKKISVGDVAIQLVPLLKAALDVCAPSTSGKSTKSFSTAVEAYIRQLFLSVLPAAVRYVPRPDLAPVIGGIKTAPQSVFDCLDTDTAIFDFIISRLEEIPHWDPTNDATEPGLLEVLKTKHNLTVFPNKSKSSCILDIALESCTSSPLSVYALVLLFIRHGFATTDSVPMDHQSVDATLSSGPPLSIARSAFPPLQPQLIDFQLLEIRNGLDNNAAYSKQARLAHIRLLSALFCSNVLPSAALYDVMYQLITHGHSVGQSGKHISLLDPPYDVFRVNLVMELIQFSKPLLLTPMHQPRFQTFLVFFQRYLFLKQNLPLDLEYSIKDFFELLSEYKCNSMDFRQIGGEAVVEIESIADLTRLRSYKECQNAVDHLISCAKQRNKIKSNLALWLKYTDVCSMFGFGEVEDEEFDLDAMLLDHLCREEADEDEDSEDTEMSDDEDDDDDDDDDDDEDNEDNEDNEEVQTPEQTTTDDSAAAAIAASTSTTVKQLGPTNSTLLDFDMDLDNAGDDSEVNDDDEEDVEDVSGNTRRLAKTMSVRKVASTSGSYSEKQAVLAALEQKLEASQLDKLYKKQSYHDEDDIMFTDNFNEFLDDESVDAEQVLQILKDRTRQEQLQRDRFEDKLHYLRKRRGQLVSRAELELEHELETIMTTDMNLNSSTGRVLSKAKFDRQNNLGVYLRNNRSTFDAEAERNRASAQNEHKVMFRIVGKGSKNAISQTSAMQVNSDSTLAKQYLSSEQARRLEEDKAREITKRLIEQEQHERPLSTIEREDRQNKVKANIEQEFRNSPEFLKGYGGQRGAEDDLTLFTKWNTFENALKKKNGSQPTTKKK